MSGRRQGFRDRLPLSAYLALRYLKSTRRDAFATFLSMVATIGIALGVAALILVLAVLSGFQRALRDEVLARSPEIEISLPASAGDEQVGDWIDRVKSDPEVISVQRLLRGQGWLLKGDRVEPTPVSLIGFESAVPRSFPGAAGSPSGVYLSSAVTESWGLGAGESIELATPRPTLTPFGPQPRVRTVTVTGAFDGSLTEQRERIALPLPVAESLLGREGLSLEVQVEGGLAAAPRVAERLSALLAGAPGGPRVQSWRELNRPLLFALRLEKVMTFVAVALVVLVASLALVASLSLIIANKRREIGMLQAMGMEPGAIRRAFLLLGGLLAGAGIALGVFLGVDAAWLFDRYELFSVPGQVYLVDYVPFEVELPDLIAVLGLTLLLALASSYYAARRATAAKPVEAMRR